MKIYTYDNIRVEQKSNNFGDQVLTAYIDGYLFSNDLYHEGNWIYLDDYVEHIKFKLNYKGLRNEKNNE